MSKYGFNENELRKTITTQIDKDGFHKETVTYGKDSGESGTGDFSTCTATVSFTGEITESDFHLNVPCLDKNGTYINIVSVYDESDEYTVVLYKGYAILSTLSYAELYECEFEGDIYSVEDLTEEEQLIFSDLVEGQYVVKGDFTVTVSPVQEEQQTPGQTP